MAQAVAAEDRARVLLLEPLDFLCRLAAPVPAPHARMIRYHGVFPNRSRDRSLLPAPPTLAESEEAYLALITTPFPSCGGVGREVVDLLRG